LLLQKDALASIGVFVGVVWHLKSCKKLGLMCF
jgi:hypothetical protein